MALIDSLKAFYRDSVEDINKLNDADSILEVLRAKYGDYKGANIEEYFKELNANDVKPGSSRSGVIPTVVLNDNLTYTSDTDFDDIVSLIEESPFKNEGKGTYPICYSHDDVCVFLNAIVSEGPGGNIIVMDGIVLFSDGTYMTDK